MVLNTCRRFQTGISFPCCLPPAATAPCTSWQVLCLEASPCASFASWQKTHIKKTCSFQSAKHLLQTSAKHCPVFLPRKGKIWALSCADSDVMVLFAEMLTNSNSSGSSFFGFQKIKGGKKINQPIKYPTNILKNSLAYFFHYLVMLIKGMLQYKIRVPSEAMVWKKKSQF